MGCIPRTTYKNIKISSDLYNNQKPSSIRREVSLKINSSIFIGELAENPFEFYEIIAKLGEGGYGRVYKVKHKSNGTIRAMKIINKYKEKTQLDLYEDTEIENLKIKVNQKKYEDERFLKEIEILKKLDHPNIMKVFSFYNREHRFYLICEYIEGEELFEKITRHKYFLEENAANFMNQIISGVYYLHSIGITHRDLKPENILVEEIDGIENLKIIDFGTSSMISPNEKLTKKTGTSFYIAPEVLYGKYNEKCDVWSCGIIMYILLCGGPPFNGNNNNEIFQAILEEQLVFKGEVWRQISEEAMKLIKQMLEKKPEKRPSAHEILNSNWLKLYESQKIITPRLVSNGEDIKVYSIVENIKEFRAEKKLQQAVLSFLIHEQNTNKEIQFLKKVFKSIDKDFDGKISRKELHVFFNKFMQSTCLDVELDQLFNNIDADKNGMIEFEEFLIASINKKKLLNEDNLKKAFEKFDFDGNGKIDIKEIKKIFQTLNGAVEDHVWVSLICKVDVDGDGEISYDEFRKMMKQVY